MLATPKSLLVQLKGSLLLPKKLPLPKMFGLLDLQKWTILHFQQRVQKSIKVGSNIQA